jgi:hypothetical protein
MIEEFDTLLQQAQNQIDKLSNKQKLEQKLQQSMPKVFAENIKAFAKYLPNIAEEFRNYKPQKLDLVCSESGHLNIIDPRTSCLLYG